MSTQPLSQRRIPPVLVAAVFGLLAVALVISCAVVHPLAEVCPDQPAQYILVFGDDPPNPDHRVKVNLHKFRKALRMHPPNWKCEFKIATPAHPNPMDIPTLPPQPAQPGTVTIKRYTFQAQSMPDKGGGTMHVTQKIGLYDFDQAEALSHAVIK